LPEPDESGTVLVIQNGNSFLLVVESTSTANFRTLSGTISNSVYSYVDSYWEEGGITNETTSFTLTSATSGSGSGTWNWAGYCSGGFSISVGKESQAPAAYDATGTWDYSETGIEEDCDDPTPSNAEGTFSISQNANRVTAVSDEGWNWKGFVNGAEYNLVYSYAEDFGITTEVCTIDLSAANQGAGECWWVWDDDNNSNSFCTGDSDITIEKRTIVKKAAPIPGVILLLDE
jgi:hypothetical protein